MADYIRKRGRVAISELAAKSNTFISLEVQDAPAAVLQADDLEADIFGDDTPLYQAREILGDAALMIWYGLVHMPCSVCAVSLAHKT